MKQIAAIGIWLLVVGQKRQQQTALAKGKMADLTCFDAGLTRLGRGLRPNFWGRME